MSTIDWRGVAAPDFSTALAAYRGAADTLDRGLTAAKQGITDFRNNQIRNNSNALMARLMTRYTGNPDLLRREAQNGTLMQGFDPRNLDATTIASIGGREADLTTARIQDENARLAAANATGKEDQVTYQRDVYRDARDDRAGTVGVRALLARVGTMDEAAARAHLALPENQALLAAAPRDEITAALQTSPQLAGLMAQNDQVRATTETERHRPALIDAQTGLTTQQGRAQEFQTDTGQLFQREAEEGDGILRDLSLITDENERKRRLDGLRVSSPRVWRYVQGMLTAGRSAPPQELQGGPSNAAPAAAASPTPAPPETVRVPIPTGGSVVIPNPAARPAAAGGSAGSGGGGGGGGGGRGPLNMSARVASMIREAALGPTSAATNRDYSRVPFSQVRNQIASQEGPAHLGGYDALAYNTAPGRNAAGVQPPKPVSRMTMGEVYDFQRGPMRARTRGRRGRDDVGSTGVGAYQFESETLRENAQRAFGKNWRNMPFSPSNQDRVAETLYNRVRGNRSQLASTWAAFGNGHSGGGAPANAFAGGAPFDTLPQGPMQFGNGQMQMEAPAQPQTAAALAQRFLQDSQEHPVMPMVLPPIEAGVLPRTNVAALLAAAAANARRA